LLGLPSLGGIGGCDLGVCGGVTPISGFEADAQAIQQAAPWVIRVVVVCAATPGCQEALVAVAVAVVAGAAVGYGVAKAQDYFGRVQDNEWSRAAKQWAQSTGQNPCKYLEEAKKDPANQDSATLSKINQAEKFLGCRNVRKRT